MKRSKLKLLLLSIIASSGWAASPSLGVTNIVIPPAYTNTSTFVSSDGSNNTDQNTSLKVQKQLSSFSDQIRGSIIQSKLFKVVDVSNNNAIRQYTSIDSTESNTKAGSKLKKASSISAGVPDYLLIGSLSAINAGEEINPIAGTNKYSNIYSIDLAVDYKLVRTDDSTIVSAFTASGHSGDVKIMNNTYDQVITHNYALLIKQVGNDLAQDVMSNLNNQIGGGKLYLSNPESSAQITDFKTYQD